MKQAQVYGSILGNSTSMLARTKRPTPSSCEAAACDSLLKHHGNEVSKSLCLAQSTNSVILHDDHESLIVSNDSQRQEPDCKTTW